MAFEFLTQNSFATTTSISTNNNTTSVANLLRRDKVFQYVSDSLATDGSAATLTFTFDATTSISRIAIIETNVKAFDVYYNGVTANTFALTSTADTTTSQWSTNSQTAIYMRVNSVACSSITFDLKSTQVSNTEKAVGYIFLGDQQFIFPSGNETPSADNYRPKIVPRQVVHTLSDGGKRLHRLSKKYEIDFSMKNITTAMRDSLLSIYNSPDSFFFCPFGTSTGWDAILHEVVWQNEFDFYQYAGNAAAAGFSGRIRLAEIAE